MADDMAQNEHEFLHSAKWFNVSSTYCEALRYDNEAELVYVRYGKGKPDWRYGPISHNMADELIHSPSIGTWFWDHVRMRKTVSGHQVPIAEPA